MKMLNKVRFFPKYWINAYSTMAKATNKTTNWNLTKLIGVITTEVFKNPENNSRTFILRTFNQDNSYGNHKVTIAPHIIEKMPGLPTTGQRVFILGRLKTEKFALQNGKVGKSIRIMAKEVYLCQKNNTYGTEKQQTLAENPLAINSNAERNSSNENVPQLEIKDQNHVDLRAQICFDILNDDTYCNLILAVRHVAKYSDGLSEEKTDFVPVFVYNKNLRNIVQNQMNKLDQVRVEGHLKYKVCIDHGGRKRYKGYIEATNIAKLLSFRSVTENQMESKKEQAIK